MTQMDDELWYWSVNAQTAPYLPVFRVRDTESSHGRYAKGIKQIHGIDLVRFHGHPCDGLFRGMYAMSLALQSIFPDGVVDRTDLRFLSRNSPCLGDVGAYLTGGRVRFGTQDVLNRPGVWYIVQRISTGQTVEVTEQEGFFSKEIMDLESRLPTLSGDEQAQGVSELKQMQDEWLNTHLFPSRPEEHYTVREIEWDWLDVPYDNKGKRTDVLYKNVPPGGE
ncbi:formylmethanofuran dehydrogenase subunit E family protein [Alicyclobacillus tolerans]|uniref:FmdE, Molybdenum formylmethanofuran dehydrogenase operon n=1 Tax=Alicyclobacillus tolerans TaxID=90970 RepID=A0A1M6XQI2_9BACL|nr:formylmethanofuran dehydrogenase subunit E family protein [Alicyclobacillus montanus]SHL08099.1 FmdE, Molybdenum formylmethanofuran dehydrogenase operon [Alicyclobacillus montanus]